MNKKMTAMALVAGLLVSGCKSAPAVRDVSPVEPAKRTPPAEAMVPCAKPSGLEDQSFGAVVRKLSEALGLLDECSSKHDELRKFNSQP